VGVNISILYIPYRMRIQTIINIVRSMYNIKAITAQQAKWVNNYKTRQFTYNAIVRLVRATIAAVEKQ